MMGLMEVLAMLLYVPLCVLGAILWFTEVDVERGQKYVAYAILMACIMWVLNHIGVV